MSLQSTDQAGFRWSAYGLCILAATTIEVCVPVWAGTQTPGYSHVHQYISELGERGAPVGQFVSLGGFVPVGLFTLIALRILKPLLPQTRRTSVGIRALMGVGFGYVAAGLAPCDPGCPTRGTLLQNIHTLAGYYHYGGSVLGLALLLRVFQTREFGRPYLQLTFAGLVLAMLGAFGMLIHPEWKGAFQRIAEFGFFGWACCIGFLRGSGSPVRPDAADFQLESPIREEN
ncbi:DUF998 domain-containing protein [Thalassoroseus pseudoceratinae]|uniref:DUF998 domain-containing protein n=1 Tax=Thalassoroseus pseudoceratinae TaxID=2713176 RepID=UPI00141E0CD7|nr:DUF998 domain-containing protein [Thalassoroseus pseudoceratinae]